MNISDPRVDLLIYFVPTRSGRVVSFDGLLPPERINGDPRIVDVYNPSPLLWVLASLLFRFILTVTRFEDPIPSPGSEIGGVSGNSPAFRELRPYYPSTDRIPKV